MGLATYNTGITSGPSITHDQFNSALNTFNNVGQAPAARPYGPAYAPSFGVPNQQSQAQANLLNMSRSALGTDAGRLGAVNYANTVNPAEAKLAADQAGAQSQAGLGYQSALGDIYSGALGRQSTLNMADIQNAIRAQGMQYGLGGSVLSNLLGLTNGAVNGLVSPLTGSLGGVTSGLSGLGGLNDLLNQLPAGASGSGSLSDLLSGLSANPSQGAGGLGFLGAL